jgi:hypothetical protein
VSKRAPSTGGNWCGHDRRRPRRTLKRVGKGKRPPLVLSETARLFVKAITERPQDFPELSATLPTDRRRRSERIEAIGLVVLALMVRADLLSLVVRWKGEGLAQRLIVKWTDLSGRRVRRALHDLRWGAFVRGPGKLGPNRIKQPVEEFDPTETAAGRCTRRACVACRRDLPHLRGKPAIRQITILVFETAGTDGWLQDEQRKRYAELHPDRPARRPMSETYRRLMSSSVRREARLLAGASNRSERPPPD